MRSLYLAGMFMYRERLQSPTGRWAHAHPQSLDCAHTCQQSPEGDAPHIHVALKMTAHMKPWIVPTHGHKALDVAHACTQSLGDGCALTYKTPKDEVQPRWKMLTCLLDSLCHNASDTVYAEELFWKFVNLMLGL